MKIKVNILLFSYGAVTFAGFFCFLLGFFPLKTTLTTDKQSYVDERSSINFSEVSGFAYKKLIFILIDALRADFVFNISNENNINIETKMNFVANMVNEKHAAGFIARAHSPTVTLPRIKAMMMGSIPGFVDIVLNFGSSTLNDDNLLHQFSASKKHLLFYGDDTWLRLFPGLFKRFDGTTSFFVTDYTEVDNNVTRHLDVEMERSDWDIIILHYLGLDHIGHLAGPRSPLIAPKLMEMDNIVHKLHHVMANESCQTLMVICGDHGMSDQGSHGGSTASEILVPIIVWSPNLVTNFKDFSNDMTKIWQVDITPTLALLFDVPIPKESIGVVLFPLLNHLSVMDQLAAVYKNALHLAKLYVAMFSPDETYESFIEAVERHNKWLKTSHMQLPVYETEATSVIRSYIRVMYDMREKLAFASINCNLLLMICGIIFIWIGLAKFYLLKTDISSLSEKMQKSSEEQWLSKFLKIGTLLHTLSLASSSFVEEEHQTWYFLSMSSHVILIIIHIKRCITINSNSSQQNSVVVRWTTLIQLCSIGLLLLGCDRLARMWNRTGNKWLHLPDIGDWLIQSDCRMVLSVLNAGVLGIIFLTVSSRPCFLLVKILCGCGFVFVYSFQSATGILYFPFFYDSHQATKGILEAQAVFLVLGLMIAVIFAKKYSNCFTFAYNQQNTVVQAIAQKQKFGTKFYSEQEVVPAQRQKIMESLCTCWILLMLLLLRPHNWTLVALAVIQQYWCLGPLVQSCVFDSTDLTILFYWMGQAAFFVQGNSNSIATVDVSAGYIGQSEYNPLFIGILMTLATYMGPIFWTLRLLSINCEKSSQYTINVLKVLLLLRTLPVAFYVIIVTLQRNHLFVWTVFSPKLLYEGMYFLVNFIIVSIFTLIL